MTDWLAPIALYLHVIGVVAWSGPAVGAGWIWLVAWLRRRRTPDDPQAIALERFVRERFLFVVAIEHVGFALLIASGLLRLYSLGMLEWQLTFGESAPAWLRWKLSLIAIVVVPMEIYDVWLSHLIMPRRLKNAEREPAALLRAERQHDWLLLWGGVVALASIAVILFLATVRPV